MVRIILLVVVSCAVAGSLTCWPGVASGQSRVPAPENVLSRAKQAIETENVSLAKEQLRALTSFFVGEWLPEVHLLMAEVEARWPSCDVGLGSHDAARCLLESVEAIEHSLGAWRSEYAGTAGELEELLGQPLIYVRLYAVDSDQFGRLPQSLFAVLESDPGFAAAHSRVLAARGSAEDVQEARRTAEAASRSKLKRVLGELQELQQRASSLEDANVASMRAAQAQLASPNLPFAGCVLRTPLAVYLDYVDWGEREELWVDEVLPVDRRELRRRR